MINAELYYSNLLQLNVFLNSACDNLVKRNFQKKSREISF